LKDPDGRGSIPGSDEPGALPVDARTWRDGAWVGGGSPVPQEAPVTITLNGREFITLLATPRDIVPLVVGFLYDEGIVDRADQIVSWEETPEGVRVEARGVDMATRLFERRVLTSGCGKSFAFASALDAFSQASRRLPDSTPWVGASAIQAAVQVVYRGGPLYRSTKGTHAAALADTKGEIVAFAEDIGRHNAVDKVVGRLLVEGRPLTGLFMVVTGRISSEMVGKVAKTPIPLVVSKSVPTGLALEYASRLSLCVVGRARGGSFTAYSHPELIDASR
jgi:FdhD protein